MKYRIIKHGRTKPYYIAQYVDSDTLEWQTVGEYNHPIFGITPTRFKSLSAARAELKKIACRQIEKDQVRLAEEDEL